MTTPAARATRVEEYLAVAVEGHGREAARMALGLIDRGVTFEDVVVDLLAASQFEVGERWLGNQWTVAEEHLVSGSTQHALDAVASTVETPSAATAVVVVCAEGDWHSLPAQMLAEMLRARGIDVAFLGASTPVEHVEDLVSRRRPAALAVSCNLPLFFAGVTRLADAAHRLAIPVLAGGRAMGTDPDRARLLGADAWVPDLDAAVDVLHGWQQEPPRVSPERTRVDDAAVLLDRAADEIADEAFVALQAAFPAMTSYTDSQLARTHEDLAFITRFVAAAQLVEDPGVLAEFLDWLTELLGNRGVPSRALEAGLDVLTPLITARDRRARTLVDHVRATRS